MSPQAPGPQDVIIAGASGDLPRRKLLPAVYNLAPAELLPSQARIPVFLQSDERQSPCRQ